MKYVIAVLLAILLFCPRVIGQPCKCGDTVPKVAHKWLSAKDRDIPTESKIDQVTIPEMIGWDPPTPDTPSVEGHGRICQITGYLRLMKLAADDCDYHMEVGATPLGKGDRVICEIPNTKPYCALRQTIIAAIEKETGKKLAKLNRFVKPPHVSITGYIYFDIPHTTKANPKKGNNHGSADVATCWEIHPVFLLTVIPAGE